MRKHMFQLYADGLNRENQTITNVVSFEGFYTFLQWLTLIKSPIIFHVQLASVFLGLLNIHLQYCAKVMQAKCANFVLCSRDFSMKVHLKVHMEFHSISSDNFLEQGVIFLRSFVPLKKIREHK